MSVTIQESTARMVAKYGGARPGVSYKQRGNVPMAVLHQGRNSGPIVSGRIRTLTSASAIHITASVNVLAADPSEIQSKYQFHLLQLAWKPIDYALYAGKTPTDGSMKMDFAIPPVNGAFLLDADERGVPPFPFVEFGRPSFGRTGPGLWLVTLEFYDHPFRDVPLRLPNFATRSATGDEKFNYLYEVARSLFFFNVFVVRDLGDGSMRSLGFINWKSVISAKLQWKVLPDGDSEAQPAQLIRAYFTSDDYIPGTPNSEAEKMIINPPTDPNRTFNALETADYAAAVGSTANSASIQAIGSWSGSVPPTHFGH